ncbi:MAG: hypothetical protein RL456_3544 [Pseudomonadota bacterium]|jgi:hypothetical protein
MSRILREITDHRITATNTAIRAFAIGADSAPPEAYLLLTPVEDQKAPGVHQGVDGPPTASWTDGGDSVQVWVNAGGWWHLSARIGGAVERHVGAPSSCFLRMHGSEALPRHQGVTWDALFAVMVDWFQTATAKGTYRHDTAELAKHLEYARLLQARQVLKRVAASQAVSGSTWQG